MSMNIILPALGLIECNFNSVTFISNWGKSSVKLLAVVMMTHHIFEGVFNFRKVVCRTLPDKSSKYPIELNI